MLRRLTQLELIGEGAQARVFRALDQDGQRFAVKVLNSIDDEHLQMFLREVQVTARLAHPNIVSIYDFGVVSRDSELGDLAPGAGYFVANYVEGGEFNANGIRNWSGLLRFSSELLDGLAHAHARGVVHRDLKPGNILVWQPDRPTPVIADFGIAHDVARLEEDDTLEVAGTPLFMAPEQFVDHRHVGPWSDLYSLGCLLWFVTTGKLLFDYPATAAIALAHYSETVPEYTSRFPVPDGFEALLRKLLEKPIASRYQFAADVVHDLRQLPPVAATEGEDVTTDAVAPTMVMNEAVTEIVPRLAPLIVASEGVSFPGYDDSHENWGRLSPEQMSVGTINNLELFALRDTTFVGRVAEFGELARALQMVSSARSPSVLTITGRHGVGRSRLAAEFCHRAHSLGLAEIWSVSARRGDSIFDVFRRLLRTAFQLWRSSSKEVDGILKARLPELNEETREKLASDLGSETADTTASMNRFSSSTQKLEALVEVFNLMSSDRALIVRIDDIGRSTGFKPVMEFLRNSRVGRTLFVLTGDDPSEDSIDLAPLTKPEFDAAISNSVAVSTSLLTQLGDATHGNVGFAHRLLNHWIRSDVLVQTESGWDIKSADPIVSMESLDDATVERLRRLAPDDDFLAISVGAVLGSRVDQEEWERLCLAVGVKISAQVLSEFDREGVIELQPSGWAFRTGGLRIAFLNAMKPESRHRVHRAAIDMIRTLFRVEARGVSERIAHHLAGLGSFPEARTELLEEVRRTANDADAEYCLALLDRRAALPSDGNTVAEDVEALLLRAQFLIPIGQQEEAIAVLNRAQQIADPDAPIYAEVVRSKGVMLRNLGHYQLSIESLEDAVVRFERLEDSFSIARSLLGQMTVLRYLGRMDDALVRAQRCMELMREHDRSWQMIAEREYGRLLFQRGRVEEARDLLENLLETFRREKLRYIETELLMDLGSVYQELRDYDKSIAYFEEAWDAMHIANDVNLHKAEVQLALTCALAGKMKRCVELIERASKENLSTIMQAYVVELQVLRAALQSRGDIDGSWEESLEKFDAFQKERAIVNVEIAIAATWASGYTRDEVVKARCSSIAQRMWSALRN